MAQRRVAWPKSDQARRFLPPSRLAQALEPVRRQDDLKRKLISAFSQYSLFLDDASVGKPLVMIYGPSGTGKTMSVELLAEAAGIPYFVFSAASVSPPGYRGTTTKDILQELVLRHLRIGQEEVEAGIVIVDEVDKWCRMALRTDGGTEAASAGTHNQSELLRYVEREIIHFTDESKDETLLDEITLDTGRLLWVLVGAFTGIDNLVRERLHNPGLELEDCLKNVIPEDMVRYGLLNELANRVRTWAWSNPLKRTHLREILGDQELPMWVSRFRAIGCELVVEPGALGRCGDLAHELGTGVRGAKAMLDRSLTDLFYEADMHQIKRLQVTPGMVQTGKVAHVVSA